MVRLLDLSKLFFVVVICFFCISYFVSHTFLDFLNFARDIALVMELKALSRNGDKWNKTNEYKFTHCTNLTKKRDLKTNKYLLA